MISIRPADATSAEDWLRMRCALWPDESAAELRRNVEGYLSGNARHLLAVLIANDEAGRPVGFAELFIRSYAEGCHTDRVAFLEGWYVEPAARGQGVGRALVEASEEWARANNCTEFASDGYADNDIGTAAHLALGFEDVGTLRCFRKELAPTAVAQQGAPAAWALGPLEQRTELYVDVMPEERKQLFDKLQALIMGLYPNAEVVMAYQIPTYRAKSGWVA